MSRTLLVYSQPVYTLSRETALTVLKRIAKALGVFLLCSFGGFAAGWILITAWNIATRGGEGFVGDGILYLMIDGTTTLIGVGLGLFLATASLSKRTMPE